MEKKTTSQRIREEVAADQARYDEVTRRFETWLQRRDPSLAAKTGRERYVEVTGRLQAAIEKYRRRVDERRSAESA